MPIASWNLWKCIKIIKIYKFFINAQFKYNLHKQSLQDVELIRSVNKSMEKIILQNLILFRKL